MTKKFEKDPDEVLDYMWDWSNLLAEEETIESVTITSSEGITVDSNTNTDTTVTVWISGGTIGNHYLIDCKIVTSSSRTFDRDILIYVKDK